MQSKKLYAWETGPVEDRALALLCGDQADFRVSQGSLLRLFRDRSHICQIFASSLQVDRKIRYHVEPKSALAIKLLREQFASAMSTRLRGKSLSERQEKWFDLGLICLRTGLWEGEEQTVGMV